MEKQFCWFLGDLGPLWMSTPESLLMTVDTLRTRVRTRLDAAHQRAGDFLATQRANWLGLAEALLESRRMRADGILSWVHAVQATGAQWGDASGDNRKAPPEL